MSYTIREIPKNERPRERLKEVGKESLSDKELLAIILRTGTKNKNVTELALEVLKNYSLTELKDIRLNKLTEINGIGETKAIELLATIELGKRIYLRKNENLEKLDNPKSIWETTKYLFYDKKQEYFYALYFDIKNNLLDKKLLFMGTIDQSTVHPREIFKEAYKLSASSIICLHNHPTNDPTPSKADILLTEKIMRTGEIQGIPVKDHIIVGENSYYSFYENFKNLNI